MVVSPADVKITYRALFPNQSLSKDSQVLFHFSSMQCTGLQYQHHSPLHPLSVNKILEQKRSMTSEFLYTVIVPLIITKTKFSKKFLKFFWQGYSLYIKSILTFCIICLLICLAFCVQFQRKLIMSVRNLTWVDLISGMERQ